ncbi:hypothetical protein JCM9279_001341 [Rhodotorula babjevae]
MDGPAQSPAKQHLIVLAGVVGSGKSTLSSAWERLVPGWVRVNQDDLGDRRACEQAVRAALRAGLSVLVDRQNFDAQQRRTWLEIATEFPAVEVGGMVMGTSKEECRQRLLVRSDHPTIDNPRLAVDLLDKFSGLWEEPRLDEGYDHLLTLPLLPPAALLTRALILSLLAALAASPRNPTGPAQRQPRPRAAPGGAQGTYSRGAGPGARAFVDDGTWRAPRARAPGPPPPQQQQQQPHYAQQQQHQPPPHLSAFPPGAARSLGHGGAWSVPAHTHTHATQPAQSWLAPPVPQPQPGAGQAQVQDVEERRRAAGAAAQARADAARRAQLEQAQAQAQGGDVSSGTGAAQGGAGAGRAGWAPPPPQAQEGPSGARFEVR